MWCNCREEAGVGEGACPVLQSLEVGRVDWEDGHILKFV